MKLTIDFRIAIFIVPDKPATIPNRPLFKIFIATLEKYQIKLFNSLLLLSLTLNPFPIPPSIFSIGTLQSSKKSSAVFDALIPIFFSGGPCVTPPNFLSTINAVTLFFV